MPGVERSSFDPKRAQDRVEIRGSVQADLVVRQEPYGFRRCGKRGRNRARLRLRLQQRQTRGPKRGLRKAANRLDNPIELEGPQGACMHRAE